MASVRALRALVCSPFRGAARPLSPSLNLPPLTRRRRVRALVHDVDLQHAWRRIRGEMRHAVSDSTWQLWLEPLGARQLEGTTLLVETPAESRAWIESSFARLIAACTKAVLGADARVQIVGPAEPGELAPGPRPVSGGHNAGSEGQRVIRWPSDPLTPSGPFRQAPGGSEDTASRAGWERSAARNRPAKMAAGRVA